MAVRGTKISQLPAGNPGTAADFPFAEAGATFRSPTARQTGWRQITGTDLGLGWRAANSAVRVNRIGPLVLMTLFAVPTVATPPDPASGVVITLPLGFRPSSGSSNNGTIYPDQMAIAVDSGGGPASVAQVRIHASGNIEVIMGGELINAFIRIAGTLHFTTADAWPASLPGVAV